MSDRQIAALLLAGLLLLPGGCNVFFGIIFLHGFNPEGHQSNQFDPSQLLIGFGILAVAALLFWVAFRRRPPLTPAILLLLPGGFFLVSGIIFATSHENRPAARLLLTIAAAILALAGRLFWLAFRCRSPAPGEVSQTPSDPEAGGGVS
jgi:hypothetical protein